MNLIQLRIRRLRELASAVRESRHVIHAQRTPLARVLKLAVRAERLVARANERLEKVDEGILVRESSPREVLDWHRGQVEQLEIYEKDIARKIARLQKDKTAADELGKAAERRAEKKRRRK